MLDFENSRIEQYKRQIGVNYQLKEPDKISLLKAIRLPRHFLHYPELIKFWPDRRIWLNRTYQVKTREIMAEHQITHHGLKNIATEKLKPQNLIDLKVNNYFSYFKDIIISKNIPFLN